ncbi:MAG TPA: histidine kinase [Flavisolibacter sp.]|nr:histidine kinase [Flavisolibacter sp.]
MVQNYVVLEHDKLKTNLELSALKVAHAEAENLLLRQQVHPHFLFNALGTLKALYRQNQKAGDTYVIHLANFLRASVSNHTNKIARLDEELQLLQDYMEMQKIRFGTALTCSIAVPEESLKAYYLPAFSLQPLLENAIKHNELTEEMPLQVMVSQQEDRMVISNNLQRKRSKEPSTGNGLANLTERYRLLSGDPVIIEQKEDLFSVSLKLLPNEYSHNRR